MTPVFETRYNRYNRHNLPYPIRYILWDRLEHNLWFQVRNRLQATLWKRYKECSQ